MARRPEDAARGKAAPRPGLSAAQVAEYLQRHPEFLLRHPEILDAQLAPPRRRQGGVVDLHQFMVERLRKDVARLRADQDDILANSRDNLSTQDRVHKAALALLSAHSVEHLVETATTDLLILLDVDAVTLCMERAPGRRRGLDVEGVQPLPAGAVDRLLGAGRDSLLRDDVVGDPEIFGAAAGLVRSDALLRVAASPEAPPGLLAFGTRHPGYFHAGQGTELLSFLVRVLEHCIRLWVGHPP